MTSVDTGAICLHSARPTTSEVGRPPLQGESASNYPVIATARLRLRRLELSDISPLVTLARDRHVADATIDVLSSLTAQDAQRWIESHLAAWEARRSVHWALSLLSDDRLVGYTGLHNIDLGHRQAEISFLISREMVRRGYATEATQAALAFAFITLEMNRVCAFHLARNRLATRILAKMGMRPGRALAAVGLQKGSFRDVIISGLSRFDWLQAVDRP